jgi:hypothetical protein
MSVFFSGSQFECCPGSMSLAVEPILHCRRRGPWPLASRSGQPPTFTLERRDIKSPQVKLKSSIGCIYIYIYARGSLGNMSTARSRVM